jgi:tRNA wybutosine-synthesizing protein 3
MPEFGDKVESVFLGKWHEPVDVRDVIESAKKGRMVTWFILYPPIIHIACRDLKCAEKIMVLANDSGFRRCGLISIRNTIVEITSLERLELPISICGKMVIDEKALEIIVDFANRKLLRGKEKLTRFYERLTKWDIK